MLHISARRSQCPNRSVLREANLDQLLHRLPRGTCRLLAACHDLHLDRLLQGQRLRCSLRREHLHCVVGRHSQPLPLGVGLGLA